VKNCPIYLSSILFNIANDTSYFQLLTHGILLCSLSIIILFGVTKPILAVLALIGLIISSAFFIISLGPLFLGLSYIIVYIGAICVLFLFVVLLLNIRDYGTQEKTNKFILLVYFFVFLNFLPEIINHPLFSKENFSVSKITENVGFTENIGEFLFSDGFPYTFLAIFLLLLTVILVISSSTNIRRYIQPVNNISFSIINVPHINNIGYLVIFYLILTLLFVVYSGLKHSLLAYILAFILFTIWRGMRESFLP
jgi:NADH-ubiquinone oxidoreductase chain 6